MAKFLIAADYRTTGAAGVLKEGGSARRAAAKQAIEAVGGKMEAFYFAYGHVDAYIICDLPDSISAIALSLTVNASGAVVSNTTPLITAEEVDTAAKRVVSYRAPGAPAAKGKK
jgi:uncharacterized protein with GYD domain